MTEEENQSVIEEALAQPAESVEEQAVQQEEPRQTPSQIMSDKEFNWAEARRKISELERRNQEQDEVIRHLNSTKSATQSNEDDLEQLADDDIVTAAQAKRLAQKMARQVTEEALRQQSASTVDERVKARFSDYLDVVTKENVDLLKQQDPELAQSLYALANDPYAQAVAAYKLLKKTGIGDMASKQPQKAKAIENSKKPVSVQSVTKSSAIADAGKFQSGFTPELRKQLWKEMQDAIKSA